VRAKLILAVVAGLLFCTLSTLEFPEFLKLVDDTSNDYSLLAHVQEAIPTPTQKQAPRRIDFRTVAAALCDRQADQFRFCGRQASGGDCLHWICVLRT